MESLKNKTIIITGSASGIGRSIAVLCAHEDMNIILADIEEKALNETFQELKETGIHVIKVLTDVSKIQDVKNLASVALDKFGKQILV